ncbi:MAG: MarR family transcriptional regulator [Dorea sp.]|nr:MarR family transcriptional regulator [Dorea sp.]
MKLDWLGEYRLLMEKIIKYANTYARTYRKKMSYGTDILISAAEIQVLEYILENEEKYQNMAEIALRLGVSSSAFSKNVKQMLSKGLLEKYHSVNNKKDVIIQPSALGRSVYSDYCRYVKMDFIDQMEDVLKDVPQDNIDKIVMVLDILADRLINDPEDPTSKELIKIE